MDTRPGIDQGDERTPAAKAAGERDLQAVRRRYLSHRATLESLVADAPTEALAKRYDDLRREVDRAIRKIDELERTEATTPVAAPIPERDLLPGAARPLAEKEWRNEPAQADDDYETLSAHSEQSDHTVRSALIVGVGLLVLAILGWFIYSLLTGEPAANNLPDEQIVEQGVPAEGFDETDAESDATTAPVSRQTPPPSSAQISIMPKVVEFGTVPKGKREARQIEVTNGSTKPLPVQLERSDCRCLWFQYPETIEPGKTATLTVIVDGALAKAGQLREDVHILVKNDPTLSGSFRVNAEIR